ncbi:16S rRNA processing protein RimM [Pikeienuella piscinae]|uniref:Ribosome maturation factor RimM n=1 Tax=Pikeienuella piscinae TaxID=2748098 RepID=A0A7L5BVL0_9RHOB|nr:ribosome maturation factor RimM [Pikeienuella piscinae]QIE55431.1 16S rRNA processing protein RimM [Pikeienuella piscinae]
MSDARENLICVGAIAGAYGVRGEARIKSFCAEPADIARYAPLLDESGRRSFTLRITGAVSGGFSARLGGVATREAAEALKGLRLHIPRDRMPTLPDDEFYHADLIGLEAVDAGGAPLGRIQAVEDFGAGDFLEIASPCGAPLLVPFTRNAVPTVDLAARRVIVDPPEDVSEDGAKDDAETGR